MKRNFLIYAIVLVIVFGIAIIIKCFVPIEGIVSPESLIKEEITDRTTGIVVSGEYGKDYEYWKGPDSIELSVFSDEIVLSGKAKENVTIVPRDDVSKLIFDNFDQGESVAIVDLEYRFDEAPIIIEYKGTNKIFMIGDIITAIDIEMIASDGSSKLFLDSGIYSETNINISNGIIYAGCIDAGKNLNISGSPHIYLKPSPDSPDENDAMYVVGIYAFNELIVDLTEDGIIEIDNSYDPEYNTPVYGYKGITIGNDTVVETPENTYIALENGEPEDDLGYVLYDPNGEYPENVIIKNKSL